jgi:hypothetical protein
MNKPTRLKIEELPLRAVPPSAAHIRDVFGGTGQCVKAGTPCAGWGQDGPCQSPPGIGGCQYLTCKEKSITTTITPSGGISIVESFSCQ